MIFHPRPDDSGHPVSIRHPHTATPLATWTDRRGLAIVLPDGPLPDQINGCSITEWRTAPATDLLWADVPGQSSCSEPRFAPPSGLRAAAGVVLLEPDGRFWLVAPSNAFGGYEVTFSKGTVEAGVGLQATAIREAYEESGLQVQIDRFLVDVPRSQSFTRYYLGRRIGGDPAKMGWESQAVMLAPFEQLPGLLNSPFDRPIVEALRRLAMTG